MNRRTTLRLFNEGGIPGIEDGMGIVTHINFSFASRLLSAELLSGIQYLAFVLCDVLEAINAENGFIIDFFISCVHYFCNCFLRYYYICN